jgi:hypothetical protein
LVIGFIEPLQIVITCKYRPVTDSHTQQFTTAHIMSSRPAVSSPAFCQRLLTAGVPLFLGSRNVTVPQLPASHSISSQGLTLTSSLTNSVTHQPTHFTPLHSTPLTLTNYPVCNISARTAQKIPFLCLLFNCYLANPQTAPFLSCLRAAA